MRRTIGIMLVTLAAIILAEIALQTSLYRWLQPAIVTPIEGAVVSTPVVVQWDGPGELIATLVTDDGSRTDLGLRRSPLELSPQNLAAPGPYRLQLRAPIVGAIVQVERRFTLAHAPRETAIAAQPDPRVASLTASLSSLVKAQEQTQAENAALHEEVASLRRQSEALAADLDRSGETLENAQALADAQAQAAAQAAAIDEGQADLIQENRALAEQITALQWRLNAALTCTVWGYYSHARPQTVPAMRRAITVADVRGEIFRTDHGCELYRRTDPNTASRCFCVGVPYGS